MLTTENLQVVTALFYYSESEFHISFDPFIKIILGFILFWQTILIGSMKIKVSSDSG